MNRSNSIADVKDSLQNRISSNLNRNIGNTHSNNQSLNVEFSRYNQKNPLAQFSSDFDFSRNENKNDRFEFSNFNSYIDNTKNTNYNRRYVNNSNTISGTATLRYGGLRRLLFGRYNFFKIDISFDHWIRYSKSTNERKVFNYDSISNQYLLYNKLSNTDRNEKFEYTPQLRFNKGLFKWSDKGYRSTGISLAVMEDFKRDANSSSITNRNLTRSFNFFRYEFNLSDYINIRNKRLFYYGFNYSKNFEYPGIDQLYTITDDINAYSIRYGNPYLKNSINHAHSFYSRINSQNPKSKYSYNGNLNGSYTKTINPIADSLITDASGKRYYYYVNVPESNAYNASYDFKISKKIKKNSLQLMYNGSYNNRILPTYIDQVYAKPKAISIYNKVSMQLSIQSKYIFSIGKTYNTYRTIQNVASLTSYKNYTRSTNFSATANLKKGLALSSTFAYTKNNNLAKPMPLWNAFATYRALKKETIELKFSAMDMLRKFQNITNSADAYGTTTRITNGLQQYFLVTISYFPRKFGKTEVKKNVVKQEW